MPLVKNTETEFIFDIEEALEGKLNLGEPVVTSEAFTDFDPDEYAFENESDDDFHLFRTDKFFGKY